MPIFEKPPIETLAPARDRWTPIYLEHGRLERLAQTRVERASPVLLIVSRAIGRSRIFRCRRSRIAARQSQADQDQSCPASHACPNLPFAAV